MNRLSDTTICAPATTPGTGAISIIRISGPDALSIADKVVRCRRGCLSEAPGYSVRFGTVAKDGEVIDEVLATVFRAPHSYTGEDSVEISCHASRYIVETVLGLLTSAGAMVAMPGEFTQRAFVNGKMDLAQAEAVADLISSQSAASHRIAMSQLKGGFSSELRSMRDALLKIVSLMELELDFSEEDVEFADRSELMELVDRTVAHCDRLVESFRLGNAIKNGIPVAIAGATNTGKSTLLNALLGEDRAIVSDIAGTTRDTIEETLNIDGTLFRFIDTAGIRGTDETVEKIGIERTFKKIEEAQVVLAMIDASEDETISSTSSSASNVVSGDARSLISLIPDSQSAIYILNKVDKCSPDEVNKKVRDLNNLVKSPIIQISAKNLTGIDDLKAELSSFAKKMLSESDTTLVTNLRHVQELSETSSSLKRVKDGLAMGVPSDLVSQDIREAIYHLGSIVGEISTDEVLGNIFSKFCIGK
ncbi:MAG: tRNA uridine-5-carboxymethylaminomethyl(34) synthesis GTPase MnmE [Bacteroidales bacterium]|nr:tRNA uridine-5-carboxymethylaminomethyl(34) synthesis GTPase MnmE [Bacteroidales bacterium]